MKGYRTFTSLLATGVFDWLVRIGIIDLTNPAVSKETLEGIIITLGLLAAAFFRKYAGKPIFKKKVG